MKTTAIASPLMISENMRSSVMGMDAAGMNTATYYMRDKIYSDKIAAVVREYACNAIDEHAKYNVLEAVQIGLRNNGNNEDDLEFFVRDFAKGLSEDDINNIFGMYFRSTKSNTNNSIGGFGVGSKAGHCYTDAFFVVSHHEGIKSTYSCMLGGGDTGVPVGHIFLMHSCPTTESGIEIFLNVKKADSARFKERIFDFVKYSTANIACHLFNSEPIHSPAPVLEKKINQYSFRLIEDKGNNYATNVIVQMGGVVYANLYFSDLLIKRNHTLIVDLPIGSMSIPLSRENFEDTVANNKVLAEVERLVRDWNEQDLAQFKNKTFFELVQVRNANGNEVCTGDVFESTLRKIYSSEFIVANAIHECCPPNTIETVDRTDENGATSKVPILVELPRVHYWHDKLLKYCKQTNKNFYYITEDRNKAHITSTAFHIQKIKKFKFPKQDRNNKTYSVYNYYSKIGDFNAIQLNSVAYSKQNKQAPISSEKEILEFNKEQISQIKNLDDLANVTICSMKYGSKNRHAAYYTHSRTLIDAMKALGWLEYNSQEYREIATKITEAEREKAKIDSNIRLAQKPWIEYGTRTQNNIVKNNKFATKLNNFWRIVLNENSTRGRIFLMMDRTYSNRPTFSRNEIRQILKLK